jgi:hypothetical protein
MNAQSRFLSLAELIGELTFTTIDVIPPPTT